MVLCGIAASSCWAGDVSNDPTPIEAVASSQEAAPVVIDQGRASWYGPGLHGRRTASGERFDMNDYTAAHRSLPFGTVLRVQSTVTGQEVEVRVNDRGPFTPGLIIDLSRAAAQAIGLGTQGVKNVVLSITDPARAAVAQALMEAEASRPPQPTPVRRKVSKKRP